MSGLPNWAARIFHADVAAPRAISFGPSSPKRRWASAAVSPNAPAIAVLV
jgi:hypothetical protein